MIRVNHIINNSLFNDYLSKNITAENDRNRIFCRHDLNHFLDVARIGHIINLEQKLNYSKEVVYAAALLHDIGKWQEYQDETCHNIASSKLCVEILQQAEFTNNEIDEIVTAILNHRVRSASNCDLSFILYTADKKSRMCFNCNVKSKCNWSDELKVVYLEY